MSTDIKLFSGNANPELARRIADRLRMNVQPARVGRFSDGEINVEIGDNVRGRDVFLIQPTCAPANDHLMELLIMGDACKRASAGRITAVIPYYGYSRQDRKARPRVPITAKLVADLLSAAGMDRILTMELHAGQIQGFFDIPVDNLYSNTLLCDTISRTMPTENAVVVSPDAGGVERARSFAKRLGCGLAIIDKRRPGPNEAEIMHIIGDVRGHTAIIVDDMIDTAGTLTKAAAAVQAAGATEVHAAASHAVLSGAAAQRIDDSVLKSVIVTDSIPHAAPGAKVRAVTVADLFADAIRAIHHHDSVSRLFD